MVPIEICENPAHTVGTNGEFPTLQAALDSPFVGDQEVILVFDGVYDISSGVVVTKRVTICGQTRDGTIFINNSLSSTSYMFLINADGVNLIRFTIRSTSESTSHWAVVVTGNGVPESRVMGFMMRRLGVYYVANGLSLRACIYEISDSWFQQDGSQPETAAISIKSSCDVCTLINNGFIMRSSGISRVIHLTKSSPPNPVDRYDGLIYVAGNTVYDRTTSFFFQDNFVGSVNGFSIVFVSNSVNEQVSFAEASASTSLDGDLYERIELVNNKASGHGGRGLFTINGPPVQIDPLRRFRSSLYLPIESSGNMLTEGCRIDPPFIEAPGSIGCVATFNSEVFDPASCAVNLT